MSAADWTLEFFLERIAEMPEVEAVQEIDLRLIRLDETRRTLSTGPDGNDARYSLNLDENRLRAERHTLVMRVDRRRWSKAVAAIWGQEGLEQALVWLATMGEPQIDNKALKR